MQKLIKLIEKNTNNKVIVTANKLIDSSGINGYVITIKEKSDKSDDYYVSVSNSMFGFKYGKLGEQPTILVFKALKSNDFPFIDISIKNGLISNMLKYTIPAIQKAFKERFKQ